MLASRKILLIVLAILGGTLWIVPENDVASHAEDVPSQAAFDKQEAAYRANNIGVALLEQYKAKEAVESFQRALEIKPDLLLARINLVIALYYLPDADAAKREAEKALTQDLTSPQLHYILGLMARAQNRFDDAITEFQTVLKIDTDDVGTNVNLGQLFVQQKKYSDAVNAFHRALAAEPYNETALYNLGLLLTRTGKREEGQQLLRKFQELKESGAGTSLGTNYLEGGRYAEAVVSSGIESELVDTRIPDVTFVDGTEQFLPSRRTTISQQRAAYTAPFALLRPTQFTEQKKNELVRALASSLTLFDFDGDGWTDLLDLGGERPRLYRNDKGRFVDQTSSCGALCAAPNGIITGAVAGDFNNDGKPDIFTLKFGTPSLSLFQNQGNGRFSDVTARAGIPAYPYLTASAAFADVDHDGDLDIFVAGLADLSRAPKVRTDLGEVKGFISFPQSFAGAANLLLRNNGNGTFTNVTETAGVKGNFGHAMGVVATDFDNRRDIDLLVVNFGTPPNLYSNQRDGTFRDVAAETGLASRDNQMVRFHGDWDYISVTAADFNKDGFTDFFFLDSGPSGVFATSDGKGRFQLADKTPWMVQVGFYPNLGAQFIDYDNDGLIDLVRAIGDGVHVVRNLGSRWSRISDSDHGKVEGYVTPLFKRRLGNSRTLGAADLDRDGDIDLVLRSAEGYLMIARNEGGDRGIAVHVSLQGHVSNRSALGAKVEMRAGSLFQKLETYSASPAPAPADIVFGLGRREKPDALRVVWPAGIMQAEMDFSRAQRNSSGVISLNVTELDRKPSSCPYLYAWNGERFQFVTDFMGGGEMGYLEEPSMSGPRAAATGSSNTARYNTPDPDEYVRIDGDQLKEKDGRYELRVTNELEEALFVDRLQLLVVRHPVGTEIYPNEGMTAAPKPFKLFVTRDAKPPLNAVDEHGHDVLNLISQVDRRWPNDFKLDRIRGYAEEHSLTLRLDDQSKVLLLLTGWTDYAWSSDNVAASQSGKAMRPPSLEVRDKNGRWRTVIEDIGIPVGRPQTVTVDLTGKFLSSNREVRIVTNMRIYWDQILVATADKPAQTQTTRLDPMRADLHWRGFSAELTPDGQEPFGYDYKMVSSVSPWKVMTGRYTREGDVRELLLSSDDMFAICRAGDEISLSFDATALPPLPIGWTRTFLLYADGFSKEMDINSASPDQILPLPFHGMSRYPYTWPEQYPSDESHRSYIEKYNTRVVTSPVSLIDTLLTVR